MYQVVKRDGKVVDFNISKISAAITKAFDALGKQNHEIVIDEEGYGVFSCADGSLSIWVRKQ